MRMYIRKYSKKVVKEKQEHLKKNREKEYVYVCVCACEKEKGCMRACEW